MTREYKEMLPDVTVQTYWLDQLYFIGHRALTCLIVMVAVPLYTVVELFGIDMSESKIIDLMSGTIH
jgi:hypothetical protein